MNALISVFTSLSYGAGYVAKCLVLAACHNRLARSALRVRVLKAVMKERRR